MFYYGRRQPNFNVYPPNYPNNAGYNYPFKKNYFQNRPKFNNFPVNNIYFDDRRKNKYYNPNINTNNSYNHKNKYYNNYHSYYKEERKDGDEVGGNSINEENEENEQKEEENEIKEDEIMKIRIKVSNNESKELILCKEDNVCDKIREFCNDNGISERLIKPLCCKVEQSLKNLELVNINRNLDKNDILVLNKINEVQGIKINQD